MGVAKPPRVFAAQYTPTFLLYKVGNYAPPPPKNACCYGNSPMDFRSRNFGITKTSHFNSVAQNTPNIRFLGQTKAHEVNDNDFIP